MVELCPGISTAATLSSVPAACGLARLKNDTNATTMPSTMMAMTRILPEGRFFFAVPNSSPMLIVGPDGGFGAGVGTGGVGGFDMEVLRRRFYACGLVVCEGNSSAIQSFTAKIAKNTRKGRLGKSS